MLPDVSGKDVCRRVRQTSQVPIIMLTAKVAEGSQLEGLEVGAEYIKTVHGLGYKWGVTK